MNNGLAIKTINSKIINGFKIRLNVLSNNVMPKETKNIKEKKEYMLDNVGSRGKSNKIEKSQILEEIDSKYP